jgi:hypothetical protein
MKLFDKLFNKKREPLSFAYIPKWNPDLPVDVDQILERAKFYTAQKLQIAVFSHGTVVIFPGRVTNIAKHSLEILSKVCDSHPDFHPITMDDGNVLIEYRRPAFTIVFKEELENHWDYIERNHLDGLCDSEVLMSRRTTRRIDRIGKIALFGRAKMFQDALDPKLVKTFDPLAA